MPREMTEFERCLMADGYDLQQVQRDVNQARAWLYTAKECIRHAMNVAGGGAHSANHWESIVDSERYGKVMEFLDGLHDPAYDAITEFEQAITS